MPTMAERTHKLSLLENSHSFLCEAARLAISSRDDVSRWPFAILNLVQAVELSLKELLRRQHQVLIYEDVDAQRHTVSITKALARLENPRILGIAIPPGEKKKIEKAIELRNRITHYEFELTEEHAMAKFSETFAFLVYFQSRYLSIEVEAILSEELLHRVIEIERCFIELRIKALQRIKDEDLTSEWIWDCPFCGEKTFVIESGRNVCFLCRREENVLECSYCGALCLPNEMHDFSDLIEADYSEGIVSIHNSYGYSRYEACENCIEGIREDIESQRASEHHYRMEEEEWRRREADSRDR